MKLSYLLPFAAALLIGCEDPSDPLSAARMEVVAGNEQTASAGAMLGQPVVVRVVDENGGPLRGVTVDWTVVEGGGYVDSARTQTDNEGVARTRWTLGDGIGPQVILAATRTASASIRATANVDFVSVSAGLRHTCAIATTGAAYCWGANDFNQLGSPVVPMSSRPLPVAGNHRFASVTAGGFHTCGVTTSGEAYCWGGNAVGQLGSLGNDAAGPRRVPIGEAVVSMSAGFQHTCAVGASSTAYCWGADDRKTLGAGDATIRCNLGGVTFCVSLPQRITSMFGFAEVSAGEFHTCATTRDGALYCWGWNSHGQIGNRAAIEALVSTPQPVAGTSVYRAISSGSRHTCALTLTGQAECWGRNARGETGGAVLTPANQPAPINSALRFTQIDVGGLNSCAIATDQRVYCWGGQLGDGTANTSSVPVAASLSGSSTSVSSGVEHTCAIVNAAPWCWGSNSHGQSGVDGTTLILSPVRVQAGR